MKPYIRKFKEGRVHPSVPDRVLVTLDCGHIVTLTYEQAQHCGERNQYLCFDCGKGKPSPEVPDVPPIPRNTWIESGTEWNEDYLGICSGMRGAIGYLMDRMVEEEGKTWEEDHERAWKLANLIEKMEGTENRIFGRFFEEDGDDVVQMWDDEDDD